MNPPSIPGHSSWRSRGNFQAHDWKILRAERFATIAARQEPHGMLLRTWKQCRWEVDAARGMQLLQERLHGQRRLMDRRDWPSVTIHEPKPTRTTQPAQLPALKLARRGLRSFSDQSRKCNVNMRSTYELPCPTPGRRINVTKIQLCTQPLYHFRTYALGHCGRNTNGPTCNSCLFCCLQAAQIKFKLLEQVGGHPSLKRHTYAAVAWPV